MCFGTLDIVGHNVGDSCTRVPLALFATQLEVAVWEVHTAHGILDYSVSVATLTHVYLETHSVQIHSTNPGSSRGLAYGL